MATGLIAGLSINVLGAEPQAIEWEAVTRIFVETNDSGPWGQDVWWVVEGNGSRCTFPQGATGEVKALAEFQRRFPSFEVKGMNSTSNATFVCWEKPGVPCSATSESRQ
jgi:hypothetical protein